ncbi:MAG: protein translocase subunit SecF, partial [Acidimicrobiia bacterium]|nr:protein translocase subunit SecF [Acidimicrobiia bacterium]
MGLASDLYNGRTAYRIVPKAKMWFLISSVLILIGIGSLLTQRLNLGIDFRGGAVWEVPGSDLDVDEARGIMEDLGVDEPKVQVLTSADGSTRLRIQGESLGLDREQQIQAQLAERTGNDVTEVSLNSVGPSWGDEITKKALRALVVFLVAITIYVTFRFELRMAIATLAALLHDVLITVGVYSITGFEVTPPTVIALLTILGFSIYDGIVVFDKVDENTRLVSSTNRMTYSDMVDLSLNQTLMRSLNTSITALLPILSLLVVGSFILGATTLQEFALALLVGLASGAYSSIFIASPLLALLKEREPRFRDVRRRIEAREASAAPAGSPLADPDPDP